MRREVDIDAISDGKRYHAGDLVKADCLGCKGCHDCCMGMGDTIKLDPYDVWNLSKGLGLPFGSLIGKRVELNVADGIILPNLMMAGQDKACGFLNEEGRCSIHSIRPGFCRLFPLGRIYEEDSFSYFLQVYECNKPHAKVKVSRWLGIPNLSAYEDFVLTWHGILKETEEALAKLNEEGQKALNLLLLKCFYLTEYEGDFYEAFTLRKEAYKTEMKRICE